MNLLFSTLKFVAVTVLLLALVLVVLWVLGPRPPIPASARYQSLNVPTDPLLLDGWLVESESRFADIQPGVAKQIVWLDSAVKQKTEWSVVYLHGFSATSEETRPMPDLIAKSLGANLFYTRLRGHGRGSDAMLDGSVQAWLNDAAEAIEIGRAIGEKVIVIGVSTGGTLAATLAVDGQYAGVVSGWIFVSPNFAVKAAGSGLLTGPWARYWLPLLVGETRSWEPLSEAHGRFWTTSYSNLALLPMAASVKLAAGLDYAEVEQPALFVFSDSDQVVDSNKTREIAGRWGANARLHPVEVGVDDDPYHHVIAGEILSPSMTKSVADVAIDWVHGLESAREAQ